MLPIERGHSWAAARQHLSCGSCGATCFLLPSQVSVQCSYCGSNQLVESPGLQGLIDPQVIALIQVDERQAINLARQWLRKGLFAPDDLVKAARGLQLRQAYYSCWTFCGTVEAIWTCEVKEGSGNQEHWVTISGVQTEFFIEVLVSGVGALKENKLASIQPFNLVEVRDFKEEYLAGWPTIIYDRPLADASLLGAKRSSSDCDPSCITWQLWAGRSAN